MRQLSDLVFRKPDLVERAAYTKLARRLTSRPVVAAIIGIAAVGNHRDSTPTGQT